MVVRLRLHGGHGAILLLVVVVAPTPLSQYSAAAADEEECLRLLRGDAARSWRVGGRRRPAVGIVLCVVSQHVPRHSIDRKACLWLWIVEIRFTHACIREAKKERGAAPSSNPPATEAQAPKLTPPHHKQNLAGVGIGWWATPALIRGAPADCVWGFVCQASERRGAAIITHIDERAIVIKSSCSSQRALPILEAFLPTTNTQPSLIAPPPHTEERAEDEGQGRGVGAAAPDFAALRQGMQSAGVHAGM